MTSASVGQSWFITSSSLSIFSAILDKIILSYKYMENLSFESLKWFGEILVFFPYGKVISPPQTGEIDGLWRILVGDVTCRKKGIPQMANPG